MKKYSMQELKEALGLEGQVVEAKRDAQMLRDQMEEHERAAEKLQRLMEDLKGELSEKDKELDHLMNRQKEFRDVLDLMMEHKQDYIDVEKSNFREDGKRKKIPTSEKKVLVEQAIGQFKESHPNEEVMPLKILVNYVESVCAIDIYNVTIFFKEALEDFTLVGGPRNRAIVLAKGRN